MAASSTAKKRAPAPRNAVPKAITPKGTRTYKFATLTAEAKAKMEERERNAPVIPPFVLDDVDPPIIITAPDDLERMLVGAEGLSAIERGDVGAILPTMRALCGDAFPRVWWLIRQDPAADRAMALLNALSVHFEEVMAPFVEAAELPGGSAASSD